MMQHHFNRVHMDSSYDDHHHGHLDHDQNDNSHEADDDGSMRQDRSGGPGSHEPETRVLEEDDMLEEEQQMPPAKRGKKPKAKSKRLGRPLKDFFEFGYDNDGVKFGVCKICRESRDKAIIRIKMTNSNTSGIQKHLLGLHKTEYFEVNPGKLNQEPALRYVKNDYGFQIGIDNVTCIGPSDLDEAEGGTPNDFEDQLSSASTSTGHRASSGAVRGASVMQRLRPRRRKMARLSDPEPEVAPPTESFESFGAFVASELRSLENKDCQKKLKLMIQKSIIQVAEEDLIIKCRKNQSE